MYHPSNNSRICQAYRELFSAAGREAEVLIGNISDASNLMAEFDLLVGEFQALEEEGRFIKGKLF